MPKLICIVRLTTEREQQKGRTEREHCSLSLLLNEYLNIGWIRRWTRNRSRSRRRSWNSSWWYCCELEWCASLTDPLMEHFSQMSWVSYLTLQQWTYTHILTLSHSLTHSLFHSHSHSHTHSFTLTATKLKALIFYCQAFIRFCLLNSCLHICVCVCVDSCVCVLCCRKLN